MPQILFCSECGTKFLSVSWPRVCTECFAVRYLNPIPVVAALILVSTDRGFGVATTRRAIEPGLGRLALPAGFVDPGETARQAVARELQEEIGLCRLDFSFGLFHEHPNDDSRGAQLIQIFLMREALTHSEFLSLSPRDAENSALEVWHGLPEEEDLCFPSHDYAARKILRQENKT